ncbi:MAG: pitrilysin family protein [Prochloraceae cyanobacterium]|nr:pitrilysin family protein [Prochloraceae cyanobacterium]
MQTKTDKQEHQNIDRLVLDNGITLISVENQTADIIASQIFLKNAGARWDLTQTEAGLSHLVAAVITKGTQNLSSVEIAERVESIGASFGASAAADYFLMSIKTISADFAELLKLGAEILRSPSFPEAEVELEKQLALQNIRSQLEIPFNIAFKQLRQAIYQDHPYGVSILGTPETVPSLNRDRLTQYHQTYFRPDNLVISICGRITHQDAASLVNEVFGDWQVPETPIPTLKLPQLNSQPRDVRTHQETEQSIVMLGYLAPEVTSRDYLVLKLLSTYLGNGLSSRLFVELREKRGLAYEISAFYPTRLDSSCFVTYMGTAPENTAIALEGLRTEVERLCLVELTPEELLTAKNKLLGQYALGKQTNADLAQVFGWYESLGLGIKFDSQFQESIAEITLDMVQTVASKYFLEPYISIVGTRV